jgi:hypothetical protein
MATTASRNPPEPQTPALVVHGLGEDRKPRAACFAASQADLAIKAASLMGLAVLDVTTPEVSAIAAKLPAGRIYSSGRGLVPNVRRYLYAKLLAAAGLAPGGTGPENAGEPTAAPGLPRSWDEIDVGHLVIAHEGAEQGWWEAIVVARTEDMLTLRWRDYPKQPNVVRHRASVALLYPAAP